MKNILISCMNALFIYMVNVSFQKNQCSVKTLIDVKKKYLCALSIYLMIELSANGIIELDCFVGETGHVKDVVDVMNIICKIHTKKTWNKKVTIKIMMCQILV